MIIEGVVFLYAIRYYRLQIRKLKKEIEIDFEFYKVYEPYTKPNTPMDTNWSIRILHPNGIIHKCQVLYDGHPLPYFVDNANIVYERTIQVGGGANFRIPKGIEKDDALVEVKDGFKDKILKKSLFKDLPSP